MADEKLPYESLQQRWNESLIAIAAMIVAIAVMRWQFGPGWPALIVVVGAGFFTSIVVDWVRRWRSVELIGQRERELRFSREITEWGIVRVALWYALDTAAMMSLGTLALLEFDDWPRAAMFLAVVGSTSGLFAGAYVWLFARKEIHALSLPEPDPRSLERAHVYAHFTGYALGLAAALIAANAPVEPRYAAILVAAAFVVTKYLSDWLFTPSWRRATQYVTTQALLQVPLQSITYWGIPWGVVVVLMAFTANPHIAPTTLATYFGVTLLASIAFNAVMIVIYGQLPPRSADAASTKQHD